MIAVSSRKDGVTTGRSGWKSVQVKDCTISSNRSRITVTDLNSLWPWTPTQSVLPGHHKRSCSYVVKKTEQETAWERGLAYLCIWSHGWKKALADSLKSRPWAQVPAARWEGSNYKWESYFRNAGITRRYCRDTSAMTTCILLVYTSSWTWLSQTNDGVWV